MNFEEPKTIIIVDRDTMKTLTIENVVGVEEDYTMSIHRYVLKIEFDIGNRITGSTTISIHRVDGNNKPIDIIYVNEEGHQRIERRI